MKRDYFIQKTSKVEQTFKDEFKAELNSPELLWDNFLCDQFEKSNGVFPCVMPRISHFTDENGNNVDIGAGGVNVVLKRDGTHEYFRSYGFAGKVKLTPVYVA
jgi:hypothetical protein